MKKRILVTGAAGFIGSHVVDRFVSEGWDVTGVDNMSTGELENVNKGIKALMVNNFAAEAVLEKIANKEFDVVCHLAAMPRVLFSVENPALTNETNVRMLKDLSFHLALQCMEILKLYPHRPPIKKTLARHMHYKSL
jgi:UDP-glucose 4-epimerase